MLHPALLFKTHPSREEDIPGVQEECNDAWGAAVMVGAAIEAVQAVIGVK